MPGCYRSPDLGAGRLRFDAGAEDSQELREPGVQRGPSGTGDEVAVGVGLVHGEIDPGAFGECYVHAGGWIGAALAALENSGGNFEMSLAEATMNTSDSWSLR